MSSPIAKLFAELGFRVNESGLKEFENQLDDISRKIRKNANDIVSTDKSAAKASSNRKKQIDEEISEAKRLQRQYRKTQKTLQELAREKIDIKFRLKNSQKGEAKSIYRDTLRRINREMDSAAKRLKQQESVQYKKKRERILPRWEERVKERKSKSDEAKRSRDQMEKADMLSYENRERKRREDARKERQRQNKAGQADRNRSQEQRARESRDHQRKMHDLRAEDREKERQHRQELARLRAEYSSRKRNSSITYKKSREYARSFIPGIGGAFALQQSTQNYQNYIGMQQGLTAATGNKEIGAQEFDYLLDISRELGVYVGDLGSNYAKFAASAKGTNLTLGKQRHIFKSVTAMGRVLNMSSDDMKGSFRAISQMMGNGQVMAQELKLQLGDRMPGAIQAMARAALKAGVIMKEPGKELSGSLFEAMKDGKLVSEKILPYFADELWELANAGGALSAASKSTGAELSRFKTEALVANKVFNEAGYDAGVGKWFGEVNDALEKSRPLWKLLGRAAEHVGWALQAPVEMFGVLADRLGYFTENGEEGERKLQLIAAALLLVSRRARMVFGIFWVLPAMIAAVNDTIENGITSFDDFAVKIGLVAAALLTLAGPLGRIKRAIGAITGGRRGNPQGDRTQRNDTGRRGNAGGNLLGDAALGFATFGVKGAAVAAGVSMWDWNADDFESVTGIRLPDFIFTPISELGIVDAIKNWHEQWKSQNEDYNRQTSPDPVYQDNVNPDGSVSRVEREDVDFLQRKISFDFDFSKWYEEATTPQNMYDPIYQETTNPDGGVGYAVRERTDFAEWVNANIQEPITRLYREISMKDIAYRRERGFLNYDAATVEQTLIVRPEIATKPAWNINVGDVNIQVDGAHDPYATGLAVEEKFMSLFKNEVRLSSMADPVMEQ